MKILVSDYQPRMFGREVASVAGGNALVNFIRDLEDHYGEAYFAGIDVNGHGTGMEHLSGADVAIFRWRWAMPDYPERDRAHQFQNHMLDVCKGRGIPVIVHDLDLQEIEKVLDWRAEFEEAGVPFVPAMPAYTPVEGYITLPLPRPYRGAMKELNYSAKKNTRMYIGNNYGRIDSMVREWGQLPFVAFGNWLVPSPHRESEEELKRLFPYGMFMGLLPEDEVVSTLATAFSTTHFAKEAYEDLTFVTQRWFEAAYAGTIGVPPKNFELGDVLTHGYEKLQGNGNYVLDVIDSYDLYARTLNEQRETIDFLFDMNSWYATIDMIA